jgi:hypothetical protein
VVLAVHGELGERNLIGDMELAGAEHPLLGVGEFRGEETDLVDLHLVAVPVSGGADGDDLLVRRPLLEGIRAVADEVFGPRPGRALAVEGAELLQRGDVQRVPRVVVHRVEEEGRDLPQRELDGAGIGSLEAGLRKIVELALVVVLGAHDVPEHVGVFRAERRRDHALVALDEIVGRDRVAVRPLGIGAEVEGVDETVGGDLPFFGYAGDDVELRVLADETLEKREGETMLGDARDNLEVEVLRLGGVAVEQDFFAAHDRR